MLQCAEIGYKQRILRREQSVQMPHIRLTRPSNVKIIRDGQIHEYQRILLVVGASESELAVEAEENAVVQSVRERGWSKHDVVGPLALLSRERIRLRLKSH